MMKKGYLHVFTKKMPTKIIQQKKGKPYLKMHFKFFKIHACICDNLWF